MEVIDEESVNEEITLTSAEEGQPKVDDPQSQPIALMDEQFRNLFGLPPDEVLDQEFSCTYKTTVVKGTLYLFSQFICFYSKIFDSKTKKIIPFNKITSIQKVQTEGAIEILAGNEKHLFSSFPDRDKAFELINDGLVLHGSRAVANSEENEPHYQSVSDKEDWKEIVETKFPINAEEFFNLFLSTDASDFMESFHEKRGDKDFSCSPWRFHDTLGFVRDVSFKNPSKLLLGEHGCCKEFQRFDINGTKSSVRLEALQEINDGPFGDCFHVVFLSFAQTSEGDDPDTCTFTVYADVTFTKRTIWKEKILQEAMNECERRWAVWVSTALEMLTKKGIRERQGLSARCFSKISDLSKSMINSNIGGALATAKTIIIYIREAVGMGNDGLGNIGEGSDSSGTKMTIMQTIGFVTVAVQTVRQVAGMVKGKENENNSKPASVAGHAHSHSDSIQTEPKKNQSSQITYEVMDEGQGQGVTTYQQACFRFKQSSSAKATLFEGTPIELAIKLSRVHPKAAEGAKLIKPFVKAIEGMKLNGKRIIVIPPEVTGLDENTFIDLTLTNMDKPSLLASKL